MSAVIYIDPQSIHPVINGEWHRTRLAAIPAPGQGITMLCGVVATATFEPLDQRRAHGVPTQCWRCDLAYRRAHGIAVPPGHPGLKQPPTPHPRKGR